MFNLFKKKPFAIQISDNRVSVMQLNGKLENAKVTAAGQSDLAVGVVTDGVNKVGFRFIKLFILFGIILKP
jgi:hypothetical protein